MEPAALSTDGLATLNERAWSLAKSAPLQARSLALQAAQLAAGQRDSLEHGKALRTLGLCELDVGNHRRARGVLTSATDLLDRAPGQPGVLAETHCLLVRCCILDQRYAAALRHGHQALEAARAAEDRTLEARALNDIGLVYSNLCAYQKALAYLLDSLRLLAMQGSPQPGGPLNNTGNVYLQLGEPGRALGYFARALRVFRAEEAGREEVIVLGNIARAHEHLGQLEGALEYHKKGWRKARALGDAACQAAALTKLGELLRRLGEPARARACLEQALALHARQPGAFMSETLLALAELHLITQAFDDALPLGQSVLAAARGAADRELERQGLHLLSRALEGAERWRDALEHHKAYHALSAELTHGLFSSQSRALLLQDELEQANHERERLQSRNRELTEMYARVTSLNEQLERQAVELERLSLEDPLTGLANRRMLERRVTDELARLRRYGSLFSVMICDIDAFKLINDRYSHPVGDGILARVGAILRGITREVDVAARMGGDEFVVLFPETGLANAVAAAEKIRMAVETYPWQEVHPDLHVTISIGATQARKEGDFASVLHEADAQLYRAKRGGRNRVCFAGQHQPPLPSS